MLVRCGFCRYCLVRRKQAWVGRMRLELGDCGGRGRFLTLTYADDPGVLDKEDFDGFMKRYRYHYGECRYFAVGEYGERGGRGHWHAIIFGHVCLNPLERRIDLKGWDKGFVYDGNAEVASIGYVAGYCLKKDNYTVMASRRPGIGLSAIRRFGKDYAERLNGSCISEWPSGYSVGGKRYPLMEGGVEAFKAAFLDAGGNAVLADPDNVEIKTRVQLGEFNKIVKGERLSYESLKLAAGKRGLAVRKRGSLDGAS